MTERARATYVPGLRFHFLTPLYDAVLAHGLHDRSLKQRLVTQARITADHRLLDLGCGTGTLLTELHTRHPAAKAIGVDADVPMLVRARQKLAAAGMRADVSRGLAEQLPFRTSAFDRVLSTFLFHHLPSASKLKTLAEVRRVIRPGGELHLMDWGPPQNAAMRAAFLPVRMLDGFANTADNAAGRLPRMMEEVGFAEIREVHRQATVLGTVAFYSAVNPRSERHASRSD